MLLQAVQVSIFLWCGAAFSSWMQRGYHSNFSFSWVRHKKIRRHRLWAVSESMPWKNLQRRSQESSKKILRIFWQSSENLLRRIRDSEEVVPRRLCREEEGVERGVHNGVLGMVLGGGPGGPLPPPLPSHKQKHYKVSVVFENQDRQALPKHKVFECVDDHFFIFPFLSNFHV